jgi:hypothetical protein
VTREAWLNAAVEALRPLLADRAGVEVPARVQVSVGFPGGRSMHKTVGQCWRASCSPDESRHIFISPMLTSPVEVLATLAHELIHAWDDCENGHRGPFRRAAKAFGLEGKMTATHAGPELEGILAQLAERLSVYLGVYPHSGLDVGMAAVKVQSTRMVKIECPGCGYIARTTRKWIETGLPTCVCGTEMEVPE